MEQHFLVIFIMKTTFCIILLISQHLYFQILYSRIAVALWKSSRGLERQIVKQQNASTGSSNSNLHLIRKPSSKYEKRGVGATDSQVRTEKLCYFVIINLFEKLFCFFFFTLIQLIILILFK